LDYQKTTMIDDPEEFAWQQLEAKQQKAKAKPVTEREALKIAHNALIEIDKETPYPLAKHALMVINEVLSIPVQDWEAIAGDQAMTIAMLRDDLRQALAQPEQAHTDHPMRHWDRTCPACVAEQEPVAWDGDCVLGHCGSPDGCDRSGCCRAAPPSRPWQSLTFEEIKDIWITNYHDTDATDAFAYAIEAALRSKNT
jgi:hypothetical protein